MDRPGRPAGRRRGCRGLDHPPVLLPLRPLPAGRAAGGRRSARRRADAQHPAQRAQQPPGLRRGGEQVRHRRIGEQVLQLRGRSGGLRQPAHEPGEAARQPRRRGLCRAGRAPTLARRRQRAGTDFCGEAGEADRGAAQPRPEQQHQRHGEPGAGPARSDGAAHALDQTGEAFGQGGGSGGRHDSDTNTTRGGLGKPAGETFLCRHGRLTPPAPPRPARR